MIKGSTLGVWQILLVVIYLIIIIVILKIIIKNIFYLFQDKRKNKYDSSSEVQLTHSLENRKSKMIVSIFNVSTDEIGIYEIVFIDTDKDKKGKKIITQDHFLYDKIKSKEMREGDYI